MHEMTRLPAFPLVTSDPYISIWSCADDPTQADTRHWSGARKRMTCTLTVDGTAFSLLGRQPMQAAKLTGRAVTPTATTYTYEAGTGMSAVEAQLSFRAPLLLDDLDLLSMPVTFIDLRVRALDGAPHDVRATFVLHDDLCYNGDQPQPMLGDAYRADGLAIDRKSTRLNSSHT